MSVSLPARKLLLMACAAGCGPQVTPVDSDGSGTSDESGADGSPMMPADDDATSTPAMTSSADSADTAVDESGDPPPMQTWCIEAHVFPGDVSARHAVDLDAGGVELWSVAPDVAPGTRAPATRYTVQRFDGEAMVTLDEFIRVGSFLMFGDVDGDGYADAVVSTGLREAAMWLAGDASGQLAEEGLPFAIEGLEHAKFGDRNGDGAIDAMSGPARSSTVLDFHMGDGAGAFELAGGIDLQIGYPQLTAHALGQRRVLLIAEAMCIGFCSPATQAVIVEADLDGTPSVLARIPAEAILRYIDSMDRNGDGLPDLLLDWNDYEAPDSGRIGWYDSPGYAEVVQIDDSRLRDVADIDLDGVVDVIELHSNDEPLTIRFGVTGEGLGPPHDLVGEQPFSGKARADLDGDGWLDFVAAHEDDGMFAIWSIVPCEG